MEATNQRKYKTSTACRSGMRQVKGSYFGAYFLKKPSAIDFFLHFLDIQIELFYYGVPVVSLVIQSVGSIGTTLQRGFFAESLYRCT
jgi:hypothetical protein